MTASPTKSKYCMVVAGDSDFCTGACSASDRLGYMPLSIENGFHSYDADNGDDLHIAVIDMQALRPAEIAERLRSLGSDRRLMLFSPTPEGVARLKKICSSLPIPAAIIPFSGFA